MRYPLFVVCYYTGSMSLPEEEITKLFRVRRTVMQMLRDRGYVVNESDLRLTRKEFVQKFGENIKKEDLLILTSKENDSSDQMYVFFPEGDKTGVPVVKGMLNRMKSDNVSSSIIVVPKSLTPPARAAVAEINACFRMEVFEEADLLVNITEHAFVPQHKVLTIEEKKALLTKYGVKETQLPRILITDPVARYFGLKRGQIVKITRDSETARQRKPTKPTGIVYEGEEDAYSLFCGSFQIQKL